MTITARRLPASSSLPEHDPGGKRLLPLPSGTIGNAVFDGPGNCYRYELRRCWDKAAPAVMFIMMNPSTAIPTHDDPSVAKCGRYARRWGYGTLLVGNTFGYRATDQLQLAAVNDPVGPGNDEALLRMADEADLVVLAYGRPKLKPLQSRGPAVMRLLRDAGIVPHVLRLSADGCPHHPLYLPESLTPFPCPSASVTS
ncbi:DUF1643 domain-containing protein [Granulibacter bethesdensis]|uniref:DUF1643 domain-containing protein n=1 Tax=Granulibacter bethesdensis TaxID=364410 RepID=UPI0009333C11|nr:DUF1643 domain-containing protein [Granulibacter bethesdensis]